MFELSAQLVRQCRERMETNIASDGISGTTDLRLSTEWRAKQRPAQRRLVTGLTLPLLPRYGYPVRPGR